MKRCVMTLLLVALAAVPARAHFLWILPGPVEADRATARVVFSDALKPDSPDLLARVARTEVFVRTAGDKTEPVKPSLFGDFYKVTLPGQGPGTVGGVCRYGVVQRGSSEPFLLLYYARALLGPAPLEAAGSQKPSERMALEIVTAKDGGRGAFVALWQGQPLAEAEVAVLAPGQDKAAELRTGRHGEFRVDLAEQGLYGLRVRHVEAREGEHEGKKYRGVRHYATLVFDTTGAPARKTAAEPAGPGEPAGSAFAPLPKAVSSLGAQALDGWLYVFGGHSGRTHQYSTETVSGAFHRLKLADPAAWEQLPAAAPAQGLSLVSHQGRLYRVGGMQPRNPPGGKADNHSLTVCERYDPRAGQWESLPDLPEGRSSHDAAVVGDKLVVVGGWKMNGAEQKAQWHTTALVLDLARQPLTWQAVPQPFQRRALTAAAHDGKVYVVGGLTEGAATVLTVNVFDPARGTWATGPDIPGPQRNGFTPASCVAGGRLYISTPDGKLHRLGAKGDAWEEAGVLRQARMVHRLVPARDDLLVAVGGASTGGNVAVLESVRPK